MILFISLYLLNLYHTVTLSFITAKAEFELYFTRFFERYYEMVMDDLISLVLMFGDSKNNFSTRKALKLPF